MAMDEAYSVIESLQSTNGNLKSRMLNSEETRSKTDVLILHNDKILVSLETVREER